ncbi:MAG: nuclease-related domain-containing protein [Actinomycetota bacterium]
MIEGGLAGGSAAHHAEQRRSVAARLVAEATWLDAVAADERTTAAYLEKLSTAYAILHDLKLSGTQGNIDHLVVGPGGAFIVLTRRFADALVARDGGLFAGERSLQAELAGLRAAAHELSQVLATPVAPVLGFHGGGLPATTPPVIGGVMVCNAENLVRVATSASHTLLPPHKVTDVTEKALPLLFNPGSVLRQDMPPRPEPASQALDPRVAVVSLAPSPGVPSAPTAPTDVDDVTRRRDETIRALRMATTDVAAGPAIALGSSPPLATLAPVGGPVADAASAAGSQRVRGRRSKGFIVAVIVSLCLVAATLGAAASMVLKDDKGSGTPATTTTIFVETSTTTPGPLAASLAAPKVEFSAVCPSKGAGWQLVAAWPGDHPGLVQYDVEMQEADRTWTMLKPVVSSAVTVASAERQPANSTRTFRITAVMSDGSRSINQPTPFTTPTSPC